MESIIRGLLVDPIMKIDRWFSDDITKHLFETTDDLGKKIIIKIKIFSNLRSSLSFFYKI